MRGFNTVRSRQGFTLVELMVVMAVIGILAAMSTPTLTRSMRRSDARESANNMAQLLRTARTQAMSRGEVVLLRIDAGNEASFATMSAAPNVLVGDDTSPVMRSCRLLTDFQQALDNPHFDGSGNPIAPKVTSRSALLDPDMRVFDVGTPLVRDLCFAPDGRAYMGDTLPVNLNCGGAPARGFVMVVGREPGGDARNLNNILGGGNLDTVCVPAGQEKEVSVALDTAYAHVIELSFNGAVTVE